MPNMSKQYQLILGTFIDNEFIWHDVDSFDSLEDAYKEFKKYVNNQLKYTDEELVKVWNTGRLDVELRRGNKLLNWVGIYAREVAHLDEDEEKEADKEEKERVKDSPASGQVKDFSHGYGVLRAAHWYKYGRNAELGIKYDRLTDAEQTAKDILEQSGVKTVVIDLTAQDLA